MSANTTISTGFWTNQSKGQVLGSTLTLSTRNGAIMIAALAVFIQITGGQSWNIICFMMHQMKTTKESRDGMHHQQQAILRNANNDINTVWQFTKIGWAWRLRSVRSFQRSLNLILIGSVHLLAIAAAGILVSRITTTGNEVLVVRSDHCGEWLPNQASPQTDIVAYTSYQRTAMEGSSAYAKNCISQSQSLPECEVMKRLALNWNSTTVPCPFGELCLGEGSTALQMITSPIDSRDDLGINSGNEERLTLARRATCVPIVSDGYTTNGTSYVTDTRWAGTNNYTFNYTAVFYGISSHNFSGAGLTDPALQNATYIYTDFRQVATEFWNYQADFYDISVETSEEFDPIPALANANATLSLIFASTEGECYGPSDDLWLSAHRNWTTRIDGYFPNGTSLGEEVFSFDNQISVLACQDQLQLCNVNASKTCTNWLSMREMNLALVDIEVFGVVSSHKQWRVAHAMILPFIQSGIDSTVPLLSDKLLANQLADGDTSLPPASNQWTLEAQNWFRIGLANGQRGLIDYVTGPPGEFVDFARNRSFADSALELAWLCGIQIVRRNDYTNFSTLAIMLVFALSAVIILTSLWLETLVGAIRLKYGGPVWKQRAWWSDGTLQLQTRAFEGVGIRGWEHGEWGKVPTTKGAAWSVLRNWDEIPTQSEKRPQGGKDQQHDMKKDNIMNTITPILSNGSKFPPNRTRSMSV